MPAFAYAALAADGAVRTGTIQADDAVAAQRAVEALGFLPTRIDEAHAAGPAGRRRVPAAQVLGFARALGGLLGSGVPLSRALTVIEREAVHPAARAAWADIHARVRDGSPLGDAMAAQGGLFAPVFIAMVRAGEAGGFLGVVLEQVADYLERSRELAGRVAAALIYPALLAVIATGVVAFLLVWFIPRFATLFASFHRELPLITRIIQGASALLVEWGPLLLLAGAIVAVGVRAALARPSGAKVWERLRLRLPVAGPIATMLARVRFCRMLGTLLKAGVPLLAAMQVARETVGSPVIEQALGEAAERVRQGEALTAALDRSGDLLPATDREGLAVAESGGRLPEALLRLAETGERELDRRLRAAVALAEPLMLLAMAALVGTIVVGMLLPIFDLWSAIS